MTQATTTTEGYDSVSQAGSGIVWSNLSNMPYPTEGEAGCFFTGTARTSNTISFAVPHEMSDIETGATFVSMAFGLQVIKSGVFSVASNVTWTVSTNYSTSTVATFTQTTDKTYQTYGLNGDGTYWRFSLTPSQIIEELRSGSLSVTVYAESTTATAFDAYIKDVTVTITYNTVNGERASLITTFV